MSKIFGLVKNEWIKQYKKVSVKIILILIILVSIAAPFILKYFSNGEDIKSAMDNYKDNISWTSMDLHKVDSSAKNAEINKKIIQVDIDGYQLRIDNSIMWTDWRESIIADMQNKERMAIMLSGIKDGLSGNELTKNIYQIDTMDLESFYNMPKEDLQKEIDKFTNEGIELKKTVTDSDYLGYLAGTIKSIENEIANSQKEVAGLEDELAKDKENKELSITVEGKKKAIAMQEEILEAHKYKYDNKIPFDEKDWKHNTIEDIIASISVKNEELLTEDQFKQQFNFEINSKGYTYEKYKDERDAKIGEAQEDLALDWYSLEKNIPQVQFTTDARSSLNNTYIIYVTIAILFCIIIGGGIVSSEYSTGTVRLLMIRPVTRWKILLSKLISVFLVGYGTIILSFIINIISSGAAHGFGSLATPVLALKEGVIVQQSFILSLVPNLMFASISLIFIIAVVFFISTVMRNTALAVGLTMVGFLGSMPATQIGASLGLKWLDKTFIPYVNLSSYVGGDSWIIKFLQEMGLNLNSTLGAIHLLVIAAILITISFMVFTKRDVTN